MIDEQRKAIDRLIEIAPETLDLTNRSHLEQVLQSAEEILALFDSRESLESLEEELIRDKPASCLLVHLAVKIAKSKKIIAAIEDKAHISVVFAVYKEHNRIRTRAEHEHGENFLLRKIKQLDWLFGDSPNFTWDLIVVDDGCPNHSGQIAQKILDKNYDGDNVRVLFLEDAIKQGLPLTRPMTSAADSQKGGSIQYGMWTAAQQEQPNHIIVFTDADLSTHLGQTGLLVDGILNQNKDSAIGSRREKMSVVVKTGSRNRRGKLFIYLWKRIIPNLNYIVDTQCGFKSFKADTVRSIVEDTLEKKFAFDIELLLKTELRRKFSIVNAPIAWIDSEAASTTTDLQPYLSMLKSMVKMYRQYLPPNPEPEAFAQFIEGLDEACWSKLVDNVPPDIANREPVSFSDYSGVKVADLQAILG